MTDWLGRPPRPGDAPLRDWLDDISNEPLYTARYGPHKVRQHKKPAPKKKRPRTARELRESRAWLREQKRIDRVLAYQRSREEREQRRAYMREYRRELHEEEQRLRTLGHSATAGDGFELPSAHYVGPLSALHPAPPWTQAPSRRTFPPRKPAAEWQQFRPGDDEW